MSKDMKNRGKLHAMVGKTIGLARAARVTSLGVASLGAAMLAAAVLAPHGASAATIRTIDFEASNLTTAGDPFGLLGISPVTTATGSFSFDPMAAPISGPTTTSVGTIAESTSARRPYVSFSVDLGPLTLTGAPATSVIDSIFIRDGVGSLTNAIVQVISNTDQTLSPGVTFLGMEIVAYASAGVPGPNQFSGTAVPDVADLNALDFIQTLSLGFRDSGGGIRSVTFDTVTFSERLSVPAPAALPLMGAGLAMMALLGWRRRQSA